MITPASFEFLQQVKENNNRDWFKKNKALYDEALSNVLDFTGLVIAGLAKIDPLIPAQLEAKDCVMRIYRDVRFSKDKSPYKVNFGIAISANGKNFNGPGYYIHIEPGKSFVGGGAWHPETEYLKSIRQEIDYNSSEWHEIIDSENFKGAFGELNTDDKLQTSPKGYPGNHPDIEFLKLKSFTAGCELSDKDFTNKNAVDKVVALFEKLYPFIVFLRNANA